MGACLSCLGLGRAASSSEPSDTSQLLADPYQPNYGGLQGSGAHTGPQPDPEEIRRQRDALERICFQTSDKLIDVSQSSHLDEASKMRNEYAKLFSERFHPSQNIGSRPSSSDSSSTDATQTAWLMNAIGNKPLEDQTWNKVIPIKSGVLALQFEDVLNLDRKAVQSYR